MRGPNAAARSSKSVVVSSIVSWSRAAARNSGSSIPNTWRTIRQTRNGWAAYGVCPSFRSWCRWARAAKLVASSKDRIWATGSHTGSEGIRVLGRFGVHLDVVVALEGQDGDPFPLLCLLE